MKRSTYSYYKLTYLFNSNSTCCVGLRAYAIQAMHSSRFQSGRLDGRLDGRLCGGLPAAHSDGGVAIEVNYAFGSDY